MDSRSVLKSVAVHKHIVKGSEIIMNNRTLVYVTFLPDCIIFRTVTRKRKSPQCFYILRSRLAELEYKSQTIAQDINSFAVIRRNTYAETIEIEFTWLSGDSSYVFGYKQTIILPYDKFSVFSREITSDSCPVKWKTLSIDNSHKQPQLIFKSKKNLHAVLADSMIRHKLVCYLRDNFRWAQSDRIEFYDDFQPYSFVFKEFKNGKPAMTGGLILHNQDNLPKARYSIHT